MTYCVAIKVNDGLVFAGDTRTSAGVDDVRTYSKLHVFENPGERVFVLLTSGNLATTQAILNSIRRDWDDPSAASLRSVQHMFDAADYVGQISVKAQRDSSATAQSTSVDLRTTLILGGQVPGEDPSLYLIYPEGNGISTSPDTPYLQIGELKYGKPILDRVIRPQIGLEDAARCALVSMDSTMKSNLSVGPPLDLVIVPRDAMRVAYKLRMDSDTPYFAELRRSWGQRLVEAFRTLPRFDWELARTQPGLLPAEQATQQQKQQQQ